MVIGASAEENVWKLDMYINEESAYGTINGVSFPPYKLNMTKLSKVTIKLLVEMLSANRLRDLSEIQILGANLYSVLFKNGERNNDVGLKLKKAIDGCGGDSSVRIVLQFVGEPEIAVWPWEYLYDRDTQCYLASKPRVAINRHLQLNTDLRRIQVDDEEIRLLLIAAKPFGNDPSYGPVASKPVQTAIDNLDKVPALAGKIIPKYLDDSGHPLGPPSEGKLQATWSRFKDEFRDWEPHIVHFVGHGRCEDGKGSLGFLNEAGDINWVIVDNIVTALSGGPQLKLVFLQACESASAYDFESIYKGVSGVAQRLSLINIPAVVAMQYKIDNGSANRFAEVFYRALAENKPIDLAVAEGRSTLASECDNSRIQTFGFPVLYVREPDVLFPKAWDSPPRPVPYLSPSSGCIWCESVACRENLEFCGACGRSQHCPKCGDRLPFKVNFCPKCSSPLKKPAPRVSRKAGRAAPGRSAAPPSAELPRRRKGGRGDAVKAQKEGRR